MAMFQQRGDGSGVGCHVLAQRAYNHRRSLAYAWVVMFQPRHDGGAMR